MAIAKINPTKQSTLGKEIPAIQSDEYNGVVVDLKNTPEKSLVTYVAGYEWAVDYYSQVVNSSNDLKALDISQSKLYQQYKKIKDLVIMVQDPLSESQDNTTKLMTVTGTSIVAVGVVPEAGDMFVASVGTGRTGLFVINKTDRLSYYTDSTFSIDYTLLGYTDVETERLSNLEYKVVETLYYNKLYGEYQKSQLLSADNYITQKELKEKYRYLINYYFDTFWAHNYQQITIPKQSFPIYDVFLDMFLHKILDTTDNFNYMSKRTPSTNYDCGLQQITLLNVLMNKQTNLLPKCKKYMGLASTAYFAGNALLLSISYSGLAYVVYPVMKSINPGVLENDPMTYWGYSFDGPLANMQSALTGECAGLPLSEHKLHNELISYNSVNIDGSTIPIVKPAYFQQTYILSNDFYNQNGNYSLLESLVNDYIANKPLNPKMVNLLATDYINWTYFDQFNYLPILMLLIKYTLKNM